MNVLSGLHDPLFPRHFFEVHHKIIAFRRQKRRAIGYFCWRQGDSKRSPY
ncbi:hypothetical protein IVZ55_20890 [Salmonella enterica subsp. enterica serovar Worthington]|nr:hypothetical protein [Salmonella enterica subsp. enterica serovar Worthington]MBP1523837.1 hypothetical protein [Salmonella enterica subsp. enterica serovar Worthington]